MVWLFWWTFGLFPDFIIKNMVRCTCIYMSYWAYLQEFLRYTSIGVRRLSHTLYTLQVCMRKCQIVFQNGHQLTLFNRLWILMVVHVHQYFKNFLPVFWAKSYPMISFCLWLISNEDEHCFICWFVSVFLFLWNPSLWFLLIKKIKFFISYGFV